MHSLEESTLSQPLQAGLIPDLFRGALDWSVGLVEVVVVVAAILGIGLIIGVTVFWMLGRGVRKLGGAPPELDCDQGELNADVDQQVVSIRTQDPPAS